MGEIRGDSVETPRVEDTLYVPPTKAPPEGVPAAAAIGVVVLVRVPPPPSRPSPAGEGVGEEEWEEERVGAAGDGVEEPPPTTL